MSRKANAVFAIIIALFLGVFCVATSVLNIMRRGFNGVFEAAPCLLAYGIICVILLGSFRGAFKNAPHAKNVTKTIKNSVDESYDDVPPEVKRKNFIYGVAALGLILLFAGGLIGGGVYYAIHMHGDKFIRVFAEIVRQDGEIFYKYDVLGDTVVSASNNDWFGVYAIEGKLVKIFVEAENTESFETYSTVVIFFVGAIFFASIGMLAFCSYTGKHALIPFFACLGFLDFGVGLAVSIQLSFGFSFFELMTSGAAMYLISIFIVFGIYFTVNILYSAVNSAIKRINGAPRA